MTERARGKKAAKLPCVVNDEIAKELLRRANAARKCRERMMPTERKAIDILWQAWQRLRELGWRDAMHCPKDGSSFSVIEAGSTGIFPCHYEGEWPNGHYIAFDGGDSWPSRPLLYRPLAAREKGGSK